MRYGKWANRSTGRQLEGIVESAMRANIANVALEKGHLKLLPVVTELCHPSRQLSCRSEPQRRPSPHAGREIIRGEACSRGGQILRTATNSGQPTCCYPRGSDPRCRSAIWFAATAPEPMRRSPPTTAGIAAATECKGYAHTMQASTHRHRLLAFARVMSPAFFKCADAVICDLNRHLVQSILTPGATASYGAALPASLRRR